MHICRLAANQLACQIHLHGMMQGLLGCRKHAEELQKLTACARCTGCHQWAVPNNDVRPCLNHPPTVPHRGCNLVKLPLGILCAPPPPPPKKSRGTRMPSPHNHHHTGAQHRQAGELLCMKWAAQKSRPGMPCVLAFPGVMAWLPASHCCQPLSGWCQHREHSQVARTSALLYLHGSSTASASRCSRRMPISA